MQWYLQESNWDENEAIRRWKEDEEWECRNPLPSDVQRRKRGSKRRGWGMSPAGSDWLSDYQGQLGAREFYTRSAINQRRVDKHQENEDKEAKLPG